MVGGHSCAGFCQSETVCEDNQVTPLRTSTTQDDRNWLDLALGSAFVAQERDLTADGLTKPEYVDDLGDAGPGRVVVIIPARNEALMIGEALESLAAQTRIADAVIVITDRCSDDTGPIALSHHAAVRVTVDNLDKKAGAINQVIESFLSRMSDNDAVMIMDADGSACRSCS